MIQLYGNFSDYLSAANVSRAIATALRRANMAFSIWDSGPFGAVTYQDSPWHVGMSAAPIGIAYGYPPKILHWLQGHRHKIMFTVCESDRIPPQWVECANAVDLIVVPSEWCRQAFIASGVREAIVRVIPHGVWFAGPTTNAKHGARKLLHVAGAASFPDRKSTAKLLRAFAEVSKVRDLGELHVVWSKPDAIDQIAEELGCDRIVALTPPARGYNPERFAAKLARYDAVVNPSRSEGFGIIPLEARCLGIPAIITAGSGHGQHHVPGIDVTVESARTAPIHVQGNAIGSAPTVSTEAIARALRDYLSARNEIGARTRAWAAEHAGAWHWLNVLSPFIRYLRQVRREMPSRHKLGAATGLGEG